jgi:alpha-glucosidase
MFDCREIIINSLVYLSPMKLVIAFVLLSLISSPSIAQDGTNSVLSPDNNTSIEFRSVNGKLLYRVLYSGEEVITWSALGLQTDGWLDTSLLTLKRKSQKAVNSSFAWPLGEDSIITNNYNEVSINCKGGSVNYDLEVRVYNGSVAFRYRVPKLPSRMTSIRKEETVFNFARPYTLYRYNQESVFTPVAIDTFSRPCDLPATLSNNQFYVSIGEAGNFNYTKAELKRSSFAYSLEITFTRDTVVKIRNSFTSPWRTISISKSAIGLHDFSQLYLKLNPPPAKGVPAWIKPGKLIRAQLNTQSGLDCIDFAANHNFQYILFDAGWYGAEFKGSSDPAKVIPEINLQKVIKYGKQKKIGVILYVNYVGLKAKLNTILPLYKKWGVAGLKFGFVDGLTQQGLTWLSAAMKKVYSYGFILNIHDNYKPTGLSRTYPNLLTQEGIRGDENSPDAFHTTTLPFTRFLAGPADFTFCYPNSKFDFSKNLKVSKGQQLALTVVYFSPLQAIFWYGQPNDYTNEGEIEFFKYVPTVWNESYYLAGEIGKYISVARRKGETWFVGNAAGTENWIGEVPFDFLEPGKKYKATIYEDDGQGSILKRHLPVERGHKFPINIKASNGSALIIEPEN